MVKFDGVFVYFSLTEIEKVGFPYTIFPQLHMKMIMVIARHAAKGIFTAPSFKNPFILIQPVSGIQTIVAPFHSDSASYHRPPSMYQNITNLDDALQLFEQMTQTQPLPSVAKFNRLLQVVTKMKHYSCSIGLFKQMATIRAPVNVYTTAIVIKSYCQMDCTTEGFAILGYGCKSGVLPNVFTFTTLLNGLVLEDRVLEAEKLFKKLIKEKLCEPDAVMYNTLIKGLCKFGINDRAIALLKLMDERGCKPNAMTYSTIIDSLCNYDMVDDALELFNAMIFHKGILPNAVTYTSLIHGLCNIGRSDDASKMLREIEDERISVDVTTYTRLVFALCNEGKVEDAEGVMNIMVERGKVPDSEIYNPVIDGYCLRGEIDKAEEILDLMKIRGHVPDDFTNMSLLLYVYCKKSKIDEALHLYHEIRKKGMKPSLDTYNSMLQGLFRAGRCKDAGEVFNEMQANNRIPPNALTYKIVLEGLCINHQVDEAFSLFRLMGEKKLNLGIVLYNILIDGASRCGKPDIARALLNELSSKRLHPNLRTYDVISNCFGHEAEMLFPQMPEPVTYNVVLNELLKNGQHDTIKMLLKKMGEQGLSVNASTLSMRVEHDDTMLKLIGPKKAFCRESI